jgi:hypothetical protein
VVGSGRYGGRSGGRKWGEEETEKGRYGGRSGDKNTLDPRSSSRDLFIVLILHAFWEPSSESHRTPARTSFRSSLPVKIEERNSNPER